MSEAPDAPWQGDACGLVDAFRRGDRSPAEELSAVYAAIDDSRIMFDQFGERP